MLLTAFCLTAQNVSINADGSAPHASAMLDVKSSNQGFLPPRLTVLQRTSIDTPAAGLLVFQTNDVSGYYYYTGTAWTRLSDTSVMPGSVIQYAGASAPDGYLLCQGQAVSRTTYAALFQIISTTYGSGDGTTTFNLPDLRQRVAVGLHSSGTFNSMGKTGGNETHTITQAQLPNCTLPNTLAVTSTNSSHTHSGSTSTDGSHTHQFTQYVWWRSFTGMDGQDFERTMIKGSGSGSTATTYTTSTTNSAHSHNFSISSSGAHTHTLSGSVTSGGSGSAMPIVQPYIVMNYIIKY
jgi:microcystin-dependent protein